jgi:ribosomal protein S18 acetylase RimI-like enzyme
MLLAHGFFRLTRLCCLQRSATEPVAPPRADIRYRPYNESLHSAFLSVIMGSYDGSMDCPELSGARTPEEILAGHRAQGQFDPSRWLLAERDGRWVGCLLLATWASLGALEIAYVAVLPHARRQGLGRELTRQAVREAATAGLRVVTLTVDERNRAASRMYEQEGFSPWDELDCYILILDPADGRTDRRPQAAESATTA